MYRWPTAPPANTGFLFLTGGRRVDVHRRRTSAAGW
jgi:hypothetical protein